MRSPKSTPLKFLPPFTGASQVTFLVRFDNRLHFIDTGRETKSRGFKYLIKRTFLLTLCAKLEKPLDYYKLKYLALLFKIHLSQGSFGHSLHLGVRIY